MAQRKYTPEEREKAMQELRDSARAKLQSAYERILRREAKPEDIARLNHYVIGNTFYRQLHRAGLGETDSLLPLAYVELNIKKPQ